MDLFDFSNLCAIFKRDYFDSFSGLSTNKMSAITWNDHQFAWIFFDLVFILKVEYCLANKFKLF